MAKRHGSDVGSGRNGGNGRNGENRGNRSSGGNGKNGNAVRALHSRRVRLDQSGATMRPLGGVALGPGQALQPDAGLLAPAGAPRQWQYPAAYNSGTWPRATEQTSFEQLRNLAALYDGILLCERVYFDLLGRLELRVIPRPEVAAVEGANARGSEPQRRASEIEAFLESPDRRQDLRAWLVAFVRDLLEIDAVAVYTRRTRGGGLHALELVDGSSMKPLVDDDGRIPQPPLPAYQQFLYGTPAGLYSSDELDYIRETARTESVYGLSRVERIILRVNQALRKQDFDLARFTDGVTPLGIIEPPAEMSWTPEQIETYERAFNGLLAGNDPLRVRAKMLPGGARWHALGGDDPLVEFDRYLLNVTVASFGLTMDELGFTETSNRSTGQTQESVVYRRAVAPVAALVAGFLTRKVRRWLDPRFTVTFGGLEEPEDFAVRAEAFARLIPLGVVTPATAARLLHLPAE
jgi:portal protein